MKLYEDLPKHVMANGRKVRLDLDFRNVLRMVDILADDDLMPEAREYLAVKCVCKHPKPGTFHAVKELLFPKHNGEWHERISDFNQDADYIRAAFRQAYHIDLYREKLHWFEFSCLLACLPEGVKYTEILGIRARPMPVATKYNTEERKWLAKAKMQYGIRFSEKEERMNYERSLQNLKQGMAAMSRR